MIKIKKLMALKKKADEILDLDDKSAEAIKKAKTFAFKWRFANKETKADFSNLFPRHVIKILSVLAPLALSIEKSHADNERFNRLWFGTTQKVRDMFLRSHPEELADMLARTYTFKSHPKESLIIAANEEKKGGE